jgi:transcriptional regulator with XRE-family HTH domain
MNIGKKLKELLKLRNIKQIELAEAVGISPARLSSYLADKREPSLDMLVKIAEYLGVDVKHFAGEED